MSNSQVSQAKQGMEQYFFRASAAEFKKVPGSPIAYWLSDAIIKSFERGNLIANHCATRKGMATGLNAVFVRGWHEVSMKGIGFNKSRTEAHKSLLRWFPYANGGEYRKWYGNFDDVVNWENDGHRLQTEEHESGRIRAVNLNLDFIFKPGLSWTSITSGAFSIRKLPKGFLFSSASNAMFCDGDSSLYAGLLNSKAHVILGKAINPTLNANPGDIGKIPLAEKNLDVSKVIDSITDYSQRDWDSYEISWDFSCLPLLHADYRQPTLKASYQMLRAYWHQMTQEMQRLEEENNLIFIDAYGLQEELTPEVPLSEITLTCNPHYRYGGDKSEEELEALLMADTMRELVSYAVGCMLGRYSLDKPGLILANQGETLADYLAQVPKPCFPADDDNVIPVLDGDWFADDITLRFRQFLRVAFGEDHYDENLAFIEQALNVKGSRFVHGGATLQEVVIPVIAINKKRQSDVGRVAVELIGGGGKTITTGQLAVVLYQAEPVTDKQQPRKLRAGIYAQSGELISDAHEVVFDFASENPRERELPLRFILSRKADDFNNQQVELRLEEPVDGTTHFTKYKAERYTIRRAFTGDFDF